MNRNERDRNYFRAGRKTVRVQARWCSILAVLALCGATATTLSAQTLTTLHSFQGQDGEQPYAPLIQATDGNLYGTTTFGGVYGDYGTLFTITPSGTLTTLYSFDFNDGTQPQGALIQAVDGSFYGTTAFGGAINGTVFKITPTGTLTTLYSFCGKAKCADGAYPSAELVQASDGNLYGTTPGGGATDSGTVFKITPSGTLTTIYSFCTKAGCPDGIEPVGALIEATDGNLYGTTFGGGANNGGTVFRIRPGGKLTTVYNLCSQTSCIDGEYPLAGLVQGTNGKLYGTTQYGGASNLGTVFSLAVGLHPFVETQPTSGKVGTLVRILGTNLTGSTNVTFNGTAANFRVVSSSLIGAIVPAGATSGKVQVATPHGTLSSNVPFRVRQ